MKKTFSIIYLSLGLAFLAVTYMKYAPNSKPATTEAPKKLDVNQQKQLEFWDYYNKATGNRIAGDYQKAAESYSRALGVQSAHLNSLYYMGNTQLELGNFGDAEAHWLKLININSASARAHIQLGNLYSCRSAENSLYSLSKAAEHFEKALQLNPGVSGALLQIAKINLLNNHLKEAERRLKEVLKSNFRSTEAYFLQGYIAWKKNLPGDSRHLLEQSKIILTDGDEKYANVGEGQSGTIEAGISEKAARCNLLRDEIYALIRRYITEPSLRATQVYQEFEEQLDSFDTP